MQNKITKAKLEKYFSITEKALNIARKKIKKTKEKQAKEIIDMAINYLNDAKYFEQQGDYVNAFAAINYAHGWLDTGSRLGIFNVKDSKLFVVR